MTLSILLKAALDAEIARNETVEEKEAPPTSQGGTGNSEEVNGNIVKNVAQQLQQSIASFPVIDCSLFAPDGMK